MFIRREDEVNAIKRDWSGDTQTVAMGRRMGERERAREKEKG